MTSSPDASAVPLLPIESPVKKVLEAPSYSPPVSFNFSSCIFQFFVIHYSQAKPLNDIEIVPLSCFSRFLFNCGENDVGYYIGKDRPVNPYLAMRRDSFESFSFDKSMNKNKHSPGSLIHNLLCIGVCKSKWLNRFWITMSCFYNSSGEDPNIIRPEIAMLIAPVKKRNRTIK